MTLSHKNQWSFPNNSSLILRERAFPTIAYCCWLPQGSVQFTSVAESCPTHCSPMVCSTPHLPVHHQLPEFSQTQVHWVGDAIQPSHPLSSPSPPAFDLSFPASGFSNESVLCIRWPKYWSFSFNISPSNEHPGLICCRKYNWPVASAAALLSSVLRPCFLWLPPS